MALHVLKRFAGANVRVLQIVQSSAPEVIFTPDPHGGPEVLWFNFKLEDADPSPSVPDTLTLTLRYFRNLLGGGDPQYFRPLIRQQKNSWRRLSPPSVRSLADGQPLLSWTIPYPVTLTEVAFCYPYGADELQVQLARSKGYWREESIGLTQSGRVMTRLDNQVMDGGDVAGRPRGLYLLARQHSGETPGSWVLDGLLEGFSRNRSGNKWCVWAIPFANLDGVVAGDYGKDTFPYDLNRAWGSPPMRHETLVLQRDMRRWAALCRPELVLDLHAPGACEHEGMYLFKANPQTAETENDRAQQTWINVLQQQLGAEFAAEPFARIATHGSRWSTARVTDFVRDTFGCTALSMEIPYGFCGDTVMTPKQYREAGRRLARAILSRW